MPSMELYITLAFLALGTLALLYVCVRDLWNATDNSNELEDFSDLKD